MRKKALAAAALAIIISIAACGSAGTGPSGQAVKAASETVAENTAETVSSQETGADDAGTVSGGITEFTYRDNVGETIRETFYELDLSRLLHVVELRRTYEPVLV